MFTYRIQPRPEPKGPGGEMFTVTADSLHVMQWERSGKTNGLPRSVARLLAEPTMTDSYVLAYLAAKDAGHVACSADEFERGYVLLLGAAAQAAQAAPGPTRPAP